jgi:predicted Na+-dependent transporter
LKPGAPAFKSAASSSIWLSCWPSRWPQASLSGGSDFSGIAALVALIAAEVHFSAPYFAVALALVAFLTASAVVGRLLGLGLRPQASRALLLTTSMRDFAIAADLAVAAFGPAAAAPLGLYGVFVLVWGTAAAGTLRHRER